MTRESTEDAVRTISYVQAISEAQALCMRADDKAFLIGQDVSLHGGAFATSRGFLDEFGPSRVIDSPIAEKAIIALAIGAAATGLRPIAEIMFMDFIAQCMDELVNQLAKMRYMFGGKIMLPVTVRMMGGAGVRAGAQHSQSLEAWLCHVPGLKVVAPSCPYDAKGLLIAAIRADDPVIVMETKSLLGQTGPVPDGDYEVPIGVAKVVRPGRDATIVTYGAMVRTSLEAAARLSRQGVEIEVIDLRTLQPLDTATIFESVRRTRRALVVHEAVRFGGFGAEVACQIQEVMFDYLDAPVGRIGAPFCPVPATPGLEKFYLPDVDKVVAGLDTMLGRTS